MSHLCWTALARYVAVGWQRRVAVFRANRRRLAHGAQTSQYLCYCTYVLYVLRQEFSPIAVCFGHDLVALLRACIGLQLRLSENPEESFE